MKQIIYTLISFLFIACNSQNKNELKNMTMAKEKFDIEKYNKSIIYYDKDTDEDGKEILIKQQSSSTTQKLSDGTIVLQSGDDGVGYLENVIPPPPAIFGSFKEFYPNGNLKMKIDKIIIDLDESGFQSIAGNIPLADEAAQKITYDENGKPIAVESYADMMKGLKIQAEQLFDILEKEKLFDRNKTKPDPTDVLERYRGGIEVAFHSDHALQPDTFLISEYKFVKGENYWWEVKKTYRPRPIDKAGKNYKQHKVIYKIDAVTGEVKKLKDEFLEPSGE